MNGKFGGHPNSSESLHGAHSLCLYDRHWLIFKPKQINIGITVTKTVTAVTVLIFVTFNHGCPS